MRITDLPAAWRDRLRPASFRGVAFHVETGTKLSGRRIVVHEFPKRDLPYAEDMGRRAQRFAIAAYLVTPAGGAPAGLGDDQLRWPDYTVQRDRLISALEQEGPGQLVHPTLAPVMVAVEGYSVTETRERGGMCMFEIGFVEAGSPGHGVPLISPPDIIRQQAPAVVDSTVRRLNAALVRI